MFSEIYDLLPEKYHLDLGFRASKNVEAWMWGTVEDTYTPGGRIPDHIAHKAVHMVALEYLEDDGILNADLVDCLASPQLVLERLQRNASQSKIVPFSA